MNRGLDELSVLEKELDVSMKKVITGLSDNWQNTFIYKLNLGGKLPVYQARGEVAGAINHLGMDEDSAGNLRLISTVSRRDDLFSQEELVDNNFYILSPQLNQLSFIKSVAPEELGLVHFLGNRIYFTTLKSKGLFYVISTENIKDAKFIGQLRLPDQNAYLYPYNGTKLISLGKDLLIDSYGNQKVGGIKLSLLDVSNINNPVELDNYVIGSVGSNSLLLQNDQDFLFDAKNKLLFVPASLTSASNPLLSYFDGALFFSVEDDKFVLHDKVDHSDGGKYQVLDTACSDNCYNSSVRSIFNINNLLYTFSNKYIKVNSLSDFSLKQILKLIPDTDVDASFKILNDDTNDNPPVVLSPTEQADKLDEPLVPVGPKLPNDYVINEGDDGYVDNVNNENTEVTEENNANQNTTDTQGGESNLMIEPQLLP